jgi:hydroxymethylbilane synthase
MTARLATHPDVASRSSDVLDRLVGCGVDVDFLGGGPSGASGDFGDPLQAVRDSVLDLALVGIRALRGSAADGLTTVAVLPREEYRDVMVTLTGPRTLLADTGAGVRIGVVGNRRLAFLRAHCPDAEAVLLDADTMLRLGTDAADGGASAAAMGSLVDGGPLAAVIMSAIEVRRLGLSDSIAEALDPKAWLPEPGQGALALVARHPIAEVTALDHLPTRTALRTELALLDAVDVSATAPLGALAQPSGRSIRLWAAAASVDGRRLVRSDLTGPLDEAEALGAAVAHQLVERGIGLVLSGAGA